MHGGYLGGENRFSLINAIQIDIYSFRVPLAQGRMPCLAFFIVGPPVFPPKAHRRIHKSQNLPVAQMGAGNVGPQPLQARGIPERTRAFIRVCGHIIHVKLLLKLFQDVLQVFLSCINMESPCFHICPFPFHDV